MRFFVQIANHEDEWSGKNQMPTKRDTKKPRHYMEDPAPKGDFAAFMDHVREHPWQYAIAGGFILVCALGGFMYRVSAEAADKEVATGLMQALNQTEASVQIAELERLEGRRASLQPDVIYMLGEKAFAERDYDRARASFERIRNDHPKSAVAPDAVEALGAILEDQEDYKGAVALYEEVLTKWPESFAALRQPLNIGRCKERLGDLEGARASYQEQVDTFPGSMTAAEAQTFLDAVTRRMARSEAAATTSAEPTASADEAPVEEQAAPETVVAPDTQDEALPAAVPEPEAQGDADAPATGLQLQLPADPSLDDDAPAGAEEAPLDEQLSLPGAAEEE